MELHAINPIKPVAPLSSKREFRAKQPSGPYFTMKCYLHIPYFWTNSGDSLYGTLTPKT